MTRKEKVRVTDKRRTRTEAQEDQSEAAGAVAVEPEGATDAAGTDQHDYLEDLQRLQAEFDNYRKRTMREQTALAQRANARLIERLLPVLDNFEAAIAHGIEDAGVKFIYEELKRTLAEEGLEEIPAMGLAFDPSVHEAVEHEEGDGETPVVLSVVRRGYRMGDRVLRPAMVKTGAATDGHEPAGESDGGD